MLRIASKEWPRRSAASAAAMPHSNGARRAISHTVRSRDVTGLPSMMTISDGARLVLRTRSFGPPSPCPELRLIMVTTSRVDQSTGKPWMTAAET